MVRPESTGRRVGGSVGATARSAMMVARTEEALANDSPPHTRGDGHSAATPPTPSARRLAETRRAAAGAVAFAALRGGAARRGGDGAVGRHAAAFGQRISACGKGGGTAVAVGVERGCAWRGGPAVMHDSTHGHSGRPHRHEMASWLLQQLQVIFHCT
eukprot:358075-Chlamydomonas_euryale.AAC.9